MHLKKDILIQIIKDGGFTCLVKPYPFKNAKQFLNDTWILLNSIILGNIISFYKYISYISSNMNVFRSVRNIPIQTIYHHPLPFSTSKSFKFVHDWLENIETNSKMIFSIYIYETSPILDLIKDTEERDEDREEEGKDEEEEITLAPGILEVYDSNMRNGIMYLYCKYKPYDSKWLISILSNLL